MLLAAAGGVATRAMAMGEGEGEGVKVCLGEWVEEKKRVDCSIYKLMATDLSMFSLSYFIYSLYLTNLEDSLTRHISESSKFLISFLTFMV